MPPSKTKQAFLLPALLFLIWASVFLSARSAVILPARNYQEKLAAAQAMQQCLEQVRSYKEQRGIPLHPLDIHGTGMIGVEYNGLTTTLGEIGAKRTTANPNMAALIVQMLHEAGVKAGDRVGLGLSGSFPAMNLAVLNACATMKLDAVCFTSVGSSTYGANNPELTFPEIMVLLMNDGYLPQYPVTITLGGAADCGEEMDERLVAEVEGRLLDMGFPIWRQPDFAANLAQRLDSYGAIACYINVGGNIASIGRERILSFQGLIQTEKPMPPLSPNSGLLELYHAKGIPVIHLLNIKKLVEDYALPFDPSYASPVGEAAIYYESAFSKPLILVPLLLALLGLCYYRYTAKPF